MEFLLDSTILIDRFNKLPGAKSYLASVRGTAAISVVTRAEVLSGFDDAYRRTAIRFLDFFLPWRSRPRWPTSPRACAAGTAGSCQTLSRRLWHSTTVSSW